MLLELLSTSEEGVMAVLAEESALSIGFAFTGSLPPQKLPLDSSLFSTTFTPSFFFQKFSTFVDSSFVP
jgi:hypothetical protein